MHKALEPLPPSDLLLHCGDIAMTSRLKTDRSSKQLLVDFDHFLKRNATGAGGAVVIGGNHDRLMDSMSADEVAALLPHATVLNNSSVTKCGFTIYGSSASRGQ